MLPDPTSTAEISPQQWHAMEHKEGICLIDCRELEEWEFSRLEGATHMPLSDFIECSKPLLERPDQPVVIYCHHGVRSLHATHWLRQQGMHSVFSLEGGIHRWALEIDSSVPLY